MAHPKMMREDLVATWLGVIRAMDADFVLHEQLLAVIKASEDCQQSLALRSQRQCALELSVQMKTVYLSKRVRLAGAYTPNHAWQRAERLQ